MAAMRKGAKKPEKPIPKPKASAAANRVFNARPDGLDFRDKMYVPTLVEVPTERGLDLFRAAKVPVLDQRQTSACTGFGLATVVHYLLATRVVVPDTGRVSPFMLYDMARRYDEWAGEDYDGSSCRGAMKGWYKHGVCGGGLWSAGTRTIGHLSDAIVRDAASRPLGAYFRVNHKALVDMHAAISEAGVLYASANVHSGWDKAKRSGQIPLETTSLGGHAFAIVGYDQDGFWIQNSWGTSWGRGGFGRIGYDDWLANGTDVWVARLGVPVSLQAAGAIASAYTGATRAKGFSYDDIRPHVVSIKNDGQLDEHGDIATSPAAVKEILENDFPRITQSWSKKRLVLYAHGGLVAEGGALQRIADYRKAFLEAECYPLAFIWHSDYWTTLTNMLRDAASRRRPEGFLDSAKDFMLDRLDDALEPVARTLTGKAEWSEMKENALLATTSASGGARIVADAIKAASQQMGNSLELHVVGHSAGAILNAPLVQYLTSPSAANIGGGPMASAGVKGLDLTVKSCTLWAPACTTQLFKDCYLPAIGSSKIGRFALFTLTDKAEQDDDCAGIYHKSLLYLVSNAFEKQMRIPLIHPLGEPILGMQKFVEDDPQISGIFENGQADWVLSPNTNGEGSPDGARASRHGDFDDDDCTVKATLTRVSGAPSTDAPISFGRTPQSQRSVRHRIEAAAIGS